MSFWGERYRRPDEEDIWEELKQMLINSEALEAEKKLQETRELEAFNQAWDRINGVKTKTASQKEPYLSLEDLLNPQGLQKRMQEQYMQEDYQKFMQKQQGDLTPQNILQKMDMFNPKKMNDRMSLSATQENTSPNNIKDYASTIGKTALDIATVLPIAGGAGYAVKGAGVLAKKLAPKLGRKIAEQISRGATTGVATGAVEGGIRGAVEDENILKTAAQDALIGGALGAGLGTVGANAQKAVRGKKLKQYGDIDLLDKNSRKQYSKNAREYYQDYNQGTVVNKDGPIEFTNRGQREVLRWNPKKAQNFPDLSKDIKIADKLPNMSNRDSGKIYTDHFEIYRGKLGDHLIEVNKNGNRRYYTTKDIPEGSLRAPSTGTFENANNIISSSQNNLNPSQQSIQKPLTHNAWLEELRRKRKKRGLY